jgi:hypothetical protein
VARPARRARAAGLARRGAARARARQGDGGRGPPIGSSSVRPVEPFRLPWRLVAPRSARPAVRGWSCLWAAPRAHVGRVLGARAGSRAERRSALAFFTATKASATKASAQPPAAPGRGAAPDAPPGLAELLLFGRGVQAALREAPAPAPRAAPAGCVLDLSKLPPWLRHDAARLSARGGAAEAEAAVRPATTGATRAGAFSFGAILPGAATRRGLCGARPATARAAAPGAAGPDEATHRPQQQPLHTWRSGGGGSGGGGAEGARAPGRWAPRALRFRPLNASVSSPPPPSLVPSGHAASLTPY